MNRRESSLPVDQKTDYPVAGFHLFGFEADPERA
jgi:hypothetical protein